jgi:hypothetical protein
MKQKHKVQSPIASPLLKMMIAMFLAGSSLAVAQTFSGNQSPTYNGGNGGNGGSGAMGVSGGNGGSGAMGVGRGKAGAGGKPSGGGKGPSPNGKGG